MAFGGQIVVCNPRSNPQKSCYYHYHQYTRTNNYDKLIWLKMQFISISMISRAANVFAARLVRHRPAACKFSRGRFDVWPSLLVIIIVYLHIYRIGK